METARQLGKEGITVLVGARDEKKSNAAAEELGKEGIDAYGLVIDVDNSDSIQKAVASVEHDRERSHSASRAHGDWRSRKHL